jgi:cytochrome c biogenesis protein CcdA
LYNIIYVIPLLLIVLIFVITLGATKISERTGRILKFISGLVMIALALIMILKPSLLSFGI